MLFDVGVFALVLGVVASPSSASLRVGPKPEDITL